MTSTGLLVDGGEEFGRNSARSLQHWLAPGPSSKFPYPVQWDLPGKDLRIDEPERTCQTVASAFLDLTLLPYAQMTEPAMQNVRIIDDNLLKPGAGDHCFHTITVMVGHVP
jgi:hypothetical protein